MMERRFKAFLAISVLVGAGVAAAVPPASAQGTGRGGGGTGGVTTGGVGNNNAVANLLLPAAALAYGAYWLAAGLRHHWLTVPHRVGHPYAITPKPTAREESEYVGGEETGEEKGGGEGEK